MKTKTPMMFLCLSLSLLIIPIIPSCKSQLQWSTNVQIDIVEDGSAIWVVQQTTTLTTEADEAAFFQYLNITYVDQISIQVSSMVSHAALITGRSMRVENLEVNANVSSKGLSKEGVIQYMFEWIGFAENAGADRISIGDAFSGEIDLSRDDALAITYPSAYVPTSIYPSPDEKQEFEMTLRWFGPRNFGAGEPHALFDKRNSSWTDTITDNVVIFAILITAIFAGASGYLLGRKFLHKKGISQNYALEQKSLSELSAEDDQERVLRILRTGKGSVLQSTIAKQCGFSKSKASELLSIMESNGIVTRRKIGREKIVAIAEKEKI